MLTKVISLIAKPAIDIARNRLLNKHTPKGFLMLIGVGIGMKYLNENEANLIINLLSGANIGYIDIWIFGANAAFFYMFYRAIKLIVRVSDCYFAEKILKKSSNNKNNTSCYNTFNN